MIKLTNRTSF